MLVLLGGTPPDGAAMSVSLDDASGLAGVEMIVLSSISTSSGLIGGFCLEVMGVDGPDGPGIDNEPLVKSQLEEWWQLPLQS